MLYSLKNLVILHPYLPITATSPQRPLSSVFKMAVVERFDCTMSRRLWLLGKEFCRLNRPHNFSVALAVNPQFFQNSRFMKLLDVRFSYKTLKFSAGFSTCQGRRVNAIATQKLRSSSVLHHKTKNPFEAKTCINISFQLL